MYTPHPEHSHLRANLPSAITDAHRKTIRVPFVHVVGMRTVADALATVIVEMNPGLVLFFATGGIPIGMATIHRLEQRGRRDLLDGTLIHLFPGLSWDRNVDGLSTGAYFVRACTALISQTLARGTEIDLLAFDTTNTGNAVNRIVKVFDDLRAGMPTLERDRIRLTVIGIVNAKKARERGRCEGDAQVTSSSGDVSVLFPAGYQASQALRDRATVPLQRANDKAPSAIRVAYWITDGIPTEDCAELLGARMLAEADEVIETVADAGRIVLEFPHGRTSSSTGLDGMAKRFGALLRLRDESMPWQLLQKAADLPPPDAAEIESAQEAKILTDGAMWIFEAMHTPREEVMASLSKPGLLTGAQIHWLEQQDVVPDALIRKVIASARKNPAECGPEAVRFFCNQFPDLAESECDARLEWWLAKLKERQ